MQYYQLCLAEYVSDIINCIHIRAIYMYIYTYHQYLYVWPPEDVTTYGILSNENTGSSQERSEPNTTVPVLYPTH